jgi:hypothetical protein
MWIIRYDTHTAIEQITKMSYSVSLLPHRSLHIQSYPWRRKFKQPGREEEQEMWIHNVIHYDTHSAIEQITKMSYSVSLLPHRSLLIQSYPWQRKFKQPGREEEQEMWIHNVIHYDTHTAIEQITKMSYSVSLLPHRSLQSYPWERKISTACRVGDMNNFLRYTHSRSPRCHTQFHCFRTDLSSYCLIQGREKFQQPVEKGIWTIFYDTHTAIEQITKMSYSVSLLPRRSLLIKSYPWERKISTGWVRSRGGGRT